MKILYIGNYAVEGSPLGMCPNAEYIENTFRELGHVVTGMNECEVSPEDILKELESGYDFILTEEGRLKGDFKNDKGKDVLLGLFNEVMEQDIPVIPWLTNIFFGIMRRQDQILHNPVFKAKIVFTTDGGHQKEFEEAGVNHVCLRQGIYEPESYISQNRYNTKAEIGFIGSVYEDIWPYRKNLIQFLKQTYGDRFEHFGERGEIRHAPLNDLCATLKIVVGDSVYSPYYWSNRVYEIIGRGGFFIHPAVDGLDEEFMPYKHYIPYKFGDFNNLKRVIDYYLEHNEEREKIRIAGMEYCKKNHTYLHRVKEMLRILKEQKII
mgnify:CR=1 FL=1